jgi:polynucleotide 5'-hydroxyl-kinase GRC3/NOL9
VASAPPPDLPPDWQEALARAADAERVVVLGPTDAGKSTFIQALVAMRGPGEVIRIVDVDPGQKMVGPPGTASLGRHEGSALTLERFVFLGSTAIGSFRALAAAAASLAETAGNRFVANTSGYVAGPGAAMQAMTLAALRPDLVVVIGAAASLDPVLARWRSALRIARSPGARRKGQGERRRIRQQAFDAALADASIRTFPRLSFEPAPPALFQGDARPVCALADEAGEDFALGILLDWDGSDATLLTTTPARHPHAIRLGKMWAQPAEPGWKLLDRLADAAQALPPTSSS